KAEAVVKARLQNDLEYAQHTEFLPAGNRFEDRDNFVDLSIRGNTVTLIPGTRNNRILQLRHVPVWTSTLQVWEDSGAIGGQAEGAFPDSTKLVIGVDYYNDVDTTLNIGTGGSGTDSISRTGNLIRIGNWAITPRCIKVVYYGGWQPSHFDSIVADIKAAVI